MILEQKTASFPSANFISIILTVGVKYYKFLNILYWHFLLNYTTHNLKFAIFSISAIVRQLCDNYLSNSETFPLLQEETLYIITICPDSPLSPGPGSHKSFYLYLPVWTLNRHGIILYVTFCICVLSVNMFSRLIHVVAHTRASFPCMVH